jgi:O-antigen/teichoic acid export membrane protein
MIDGALSDRHSPYDAARRRFESPTMMRAMFGSRFLWIGVALLVLGTGPLLVTIVLDPTADPVGFGMLTFFTFWPSILLIVVGLGHGVARTVQLRKDLAR